MNKNLLGDRMKEYENVSRNYLLKKTPVILRLDGRSFHTITKNIFGKNTWNYEFHSFMLDSAKKLIEQIHGCYFCYVQSDEISCLLTDYETENTGAWFDYNIQKMVSISSSIISVEMSKLLNKDVQFDSRVFNLSREEVTNYFIWRQQDALRNSIQQMGREHFSHKELENKSCNEIQDMVWQKSNVNWNDFPTYRKLGSCVYKNQRQYIIDYDIPEFKKERRYVERVVFRGIYASRFDFVTEYYHDCKRLKDLIKKEFKMLMSLNYCAKLWKDISEKYYVTWLILPENQKELISIIKEEIES